MRNKKKKVFRFLLIAFAVLFVSLFFLNNRNDSNVFDWKDSTESVVFSGSRSLGYGINNNGLVKSTGENIQLYDFTSRKAVYACSNPNCSHDDRNCSSFISDGMDVNGLAAFANGKIYSIKSDFSSNKYLFCKMNINGTDSVVVHNFSDYFKDNIYPLSFSQLAVTADYAVIEAQCTEFSDSINDGSVESIDFYCVFLVDLRNGSLNVLDTRNLVLVSPEFIVVNDCSDGHLFSHFYIYDLKKNDYLIGTEDFANVNLDDSEPWLSIMGLWQNKLYYSFSAGKLYDSSASVYSFDLITKEIDSVFSVEHGGIIGVPYCQSDDIIFNSGFFYDKITSNEFVNTDVYFYDLETGTSSLAYVDKGPGISISLRGETKDDFIYEAYNTKTGIAALKIIPKELLYRGDFSKSKNIHF